MRSLVYDPQLIHPFELAAVAVLAFRKSVVHGRPSVWAIHWFFKLG